MSDQQSNTTGRHVLPVVRKMREEIDDHYVRFVGPYGRMLAEEAYEEWVMGGHTGPSSLVRYIKLLAKFVPDANRREEFEALATECISINR